MFTGSTKTGRTVASQAGEQLMGASMELGGKNAMIVLADANVGRAVEGAERALFSNAGQLCISIERLFVHESIADEFTPSWSSACGDEARHVARLRAEHGLALVAGAARHRRGARGRRGVEGRRGARGRPRAARRGPYFYEPTLLGRVADGMTLFRDETFGPVVAVSRFSDEEEVIARANDSDYGLNFSLWTRDTRRGLEIGSRLQAGTVNVNEGYIAAWASVDAPMGGMKASGPRPPPRRRRHHEVHGVADRGGPEADADRASAGRAVPAVGAADDAVAAAVASHSRHPLTYGGRRWRASYPTR